MAHQRKRKIQQNLSLKKYLMANILDRQKRRKKPVLKMLKELKEDVEKVKKMMCEQNGNINKEMKKP